LELKSTADFVRMTRDVLTDAGFVRKSVGDTVYWESADPASQTSPLVLVHGVNDQAGSWFTVAPALAQTRRVIIPDLLGHGESGPESGPLPLSQFLERLEAVIGNEREITLVGNSLGGWIVTLFALAHPERVKHLVLEASGGLARPFASPVLARDREEAALILRAVHGPNFLPPEWAIDSLMQRSIDSPMLRITDTEPYVLDGHLAELHMPTTLIWGADDGVLPLSYAEEMLGLIDGAELRVIEGAAHIPHVQQPQRFLQCLTAIC
jgi:pimeloyl-ACP methyl ester carboxylesterase